MDHMLIFSFLVIVLVGAWSAIITRHLYRSRGVPVLRRLFIYVVWFNIMVFGYLVSKYSFTNLLGHDPTKYPDSLLAVTAAPIFIIHAGVAWSALRLALELRRRPLTRLVESVFAVIAALFCISYAVGITLVLQSSSWLWLLRSHAAIGATMTVVTVAVFFRLVVGGHGGLTENQIKSVRRLGWYLLCGHVALAGSIAFPEPEHLVAAAAVLLWLNCVPLIWLRRGFGLYHRASAPEEEKGIEALVQAHGITPREREIMELMVQGKSNKEIEDELCISFSTVKNHAYNMYRKLEVNSRAQLMYLVMTSALKPGDATIDSTGYQRVPPVDQ